MKEDIKLNLFDKKVPRGRFLDDLSYLNEFNEEYIISFIKKAGRLSRKEGSENYSGRLINWLKSLNKEEKRKFVGAIQSLMFMVLKFYSGKITESELKEDAKRLGLSRQIIEFIQKPFSEKFIARTPSEELKFISKITLPLIEKIRKQKNLKRKIDVTEYGEIKEMTKNLEEKTSENIVNPAEIDPKILRFDKKYIGKCVAIRYNKIVMSDGNIHQLIKEANQEYGQGNFTVASVPDPRYVQF